MFPRGQERILYGILGVGHIIQLAPGNPKKIREAFRHHACQFGCAVDKPIVELLRPFRLRSCHARDLLLKVLVQASG
jgi:hypothetical protein